MSKREGKMKKKIKVLIGLLIALILVSGFVIAWGKGWIRPRADTAEKITKSNPQPPVQDHILVKFKDKVSDEKKNEIHAKTGGKVKDEISQIDVEIVQIPPGKGIDPETFVETYKANFKEELEYAEPDYLVEPTLSANDPYWVYHWQLPLEALGAASAWDITTGNPSVVIAVLDSGIDYTHPDHQGGRLILGPDFANNDNDPYDDAGHGTIVTGVVGASTNNGVGIAGATWGNKILAIKIAGSNGYSTWSWMAKGLTYAADQGARVANISFASPTSSSTIANAVSYAYQKGVVITAAAGNSVAPPQYPAAYPEVIAVSGINGSDQWLYGYGPYISVTAYAGAYTTQNPFGTPYYYGSWGGTSVAAPYVAGAAALVFSVNPSLTPAQVRDIIQRTADDLGDPGWDQYYGWGKLNLYKAVLAAKNGVMPTTGTISGHVTSNGTALSGATITALQSGVAKGQSTTSSDGSYALPNLTAGTYDIKAEKTGYTTQTQTGKAVSAGQVTTVDFALISSVTVGNISGTITSSSGQALGQATVSAYQSGTLVKSVSSLSDGTYYISNLNTGTYDLTASLSGFQSQTKTGIAVTSGQTTSGINFSLTANPSQTYGSLTGVVTNSSGQIQSGVKVTATLSGASYSATTNTSGVYTFTNLPTGTYTVKASSKGTFATATGVVISAGQTTVQNLTLTKSGKK